MGSDHGTVIITGSSGLIGSALTLALHDRYHIAAFDNQGPPHPPPDVDCVNVDLTSDTSVREAMEHVRRTRGGRIESVVHLAAYYDFAGEPSPMYDKLTVGGTERLLRSLQDFDVGQFVFSSTSLVYAPTEPGRPLGEDAPLEPKWDYPKSKAATEGLIMARRGPMPVVLLRIAGVYDEKGHSPPLTNHVQRIAERWATSRVYPGDVRHGQAFIHLDDLVDALVRVVDRRAQLPPALILNLAEPETLSFDAIQRELGRLLHGEEWETTTIPKVVAKAGAWAQEALPGEDPFIKPWMVDIADDHMELDVTRARTLLGWEPRHSLREALPAMVESLRADPEKFYRDNNLAPPSDLAKVIGSAKAD